MKLPGKGIDVSYHNGTIDWNKVKPHIDFAIIRAGYGSKTIDKQFEHNAKECQRLNIPFGVYWFSYALKPESAKDEADLCCDLIEQYSIKFPVCFDFEYDSLSYAKKCGVTLSKQQVVNIAKAFLDRVEERGYYAMIYTNKDLITKYFAELLPRYDLWLAHWGAKVPYRACGIWQDTDSAFIEGIKGKVDADLCYKDYTEIIKAKEIPEEKEDTPLVFGELKDYWFEIYYNVASEVINGMWGVGEARKTALHANGYDYNMVQSIVNAMIAEGL